MSGVEGVTPVESDVHQPAEKVLHPQQAENNAHDEDNVSSFVSFCTHASTPFDAILLAQAQNLRGDVDNIRLNICEHMKASLDTFANVTADGIRKCSLLNKFTLATSLLSLLESADKVCATVSGRRLSDPGIKEADISTALHGIGNSDDSLKASLQAIHESLHDLRNNKKNDMFTSIQEQLEDLRVAVGQFKKPRASDASTPEYLSVPKFHVSKPPQLVQDEKSEVNILDIQSTPKPSDPCIKSYVENFISNDTAEKLMDFLGGEKANFDKNTERGHSVISFGETYDYTGAKAVAPISQVLPDVITELVESIKRIHPECVVNQCLINRYLDQNSQLPQHSDDEDAIVFGSDIYTISVGDPCDVVFHRRDNSVDDKPKTVSGNSLYVMSKSSQLTWAHRIDPCLEARGLRYSITFRYVSQHNDNVTVVKGDSNTRHLKFGSGKNTFGDKMPGKRVECFTIDQIHPEDCRGYKNVFVHCGINNIKRNGANVHEAAKQLIAKLDLICQLCPGSKITVSPLLPTKLPTLNQKAIHFNKIIFDYCTSNPRVGSLDFNCFLDDDNLLSESYGRYFDKTDAIHLGSSGIFRLSRIIANKIFQNPTDGRSYSNVVSGENLNNSRKPVFLIND